MDDEKLRLSLRALTVTRRLLDFEPVKRLLEMLDVMQEDVHDVRRVAAIGAYAASLLPFDLNPGQAILSFLKEDRNAYVEAILTGRNDQLVLDVENMLEEELEILQAATEVSSADMQSYLHYDGYLPSWETGTVDLNMAYHDYLHTARTSGIGNLREHHMFLLGRRGLYPASNPDPIRLEDLHGYERQRSIVLKNTQLLLDNKAASNVLLYGDSGTGKSSTVKAVANHFAKDGLRLVEIKKSQLHRIPRLLEYLSREPLHFVLFIDDLSFTEENDDFSALKGILEGSVLSRTKNVVIYATSNRRRIIKETFSDRGSDDIHANETIQQKTALSDRFGITLPFMNPRREEYLKMVREMAEGTGLSDDELVEGAERYALEKGGRSGRVARQFVEQLALEG